MELLPLAPARAALAHALAALEAAIAGSAEEARAAFTPTPLERALAVKEDREALSAEAMVRAGEEAGVGVKARVGSEVGAQW